MHTMILRGSFGIEIVFFEINSKTYLNFPEPIFYRFQDLPEHFQKIAKSLKTTYLVDSEYVEISFEKDLKIQTISL